VIVHGFECRSLGHEINCCQLKIFSKSWKHIDNLCIYSFWVPFECELFVGETKHANVLWNSFYSYNSFQMWMLIEKI
jgi:hypothetical protein